MQIRPEAERKLRAGFQRHVDEQGDRYVVQWTHAELLAARFGRGEVVGVFSARAGGGVRPRVHVVGLLPLAAIPILIAGAGHSTAPRPHAMRHRPPETTSRQASLAVPYLTKPNRPSMATIRTPHCQRGQLRSRLDLRSGAVEVRHCQFWARLGDVRGSQNTATPPPCQVPAVVL